jgi:hypothetical protein
VILRKALKISSKQPTITKVPKIYAPVNTLFVENSSARNKKVNNSESAFRITSKLSFINMPEMTASRAISNRS